jgi:hypothetical protein
MCIICAPKEYFMTIKEKEHLVVRVDDIQNELNQGFLFEQNKKSKKDIKRVNLLLPTELYNEAKELGEKTGIGYQNTLKMAITIGLKDLKGRLDD